MAQPPRRLLLCVDNSDSSEEAVRWALENIYRSGDEIHIVHVIPRFMLSGSYAYPPIDYLPQKNHAHQDHVIKSAEAFIVKRALRHIEKLGSSVQPIVHIVKYETDADSVGELLCRKARELQVAVMVLARHDKTKLQKIFLGSVCGYCAAHSSQPLLIYPP